MRAVPRGMQSLAAAWNSLHSFVLTRPCAVDRTLQSKREPTTSFFFFASHLPVRLDSTDTLFHVSHCPLLSLKQYFCKYWCHGLSSVLSAVDLTVLILCFTRHIISCCLWSSTFFQTLMPWFIFCVVGYRLDSTDTMFHMSRSVVAFETVLFQILMPCKSFTWYIVWCRLLAVLDQISLITLL